MNKYIVLEQIHRVSEGRWLHKKSFWVEQINRSEMLGCKDGFTKMLGRKKSYTTKNSRWVAMMASQKMASQIDGNKCLKRKL